MRARFAAVFFDLDGTLLRGTSVSVVTASWLGRGGALDELERRYADGAISNAVVANTSAEWFTDRPLDEATAALWAAPWIAGIRETVDALHAGGAYVALATVTWRFAASAVAQRFGFDACCGTEMTIAGGRLAGTVSRYCDADDKARFVSEACAERGLNAAEAAAVGDSRSDLPTFARVGYSIALNADDGARRAASVALDTEDLRDVLPFLLHHG